jgi:hypothetical protein
MSLQTTRIPEAESQAIHLHRHLTKGGGMNAPTKASPIDPLLHPKEAAKLLNVSDSWLAKSRLTGTGPREAFYQRTHRPPQM